MHTNLYVTARDNRWQKLPMAIQTPGESTFIKQECRCLIRINGAWAYLESGTDFGRAYRGNGEPRHQNVRA